MFLQIFHFTRELTNGTMTDKHETKREIKQFAPKKSAPPLTKEEQKSIYSDVTISKSRLKGESISPMWLLLLNVIPEML